VHGRQTLLTVQNDVLRPAGILFVGINGLTGQGPEIFILTLPEQQAADVIIQKDGPHQCADVPGLPFKIPLEVGDHILSFANTAYQGGEAYVVWFLYVFHSG